MFALRIPAAKFAKYTTEGSGFVLGCKCLLPVHEPMEVVAWQSGAWRIKLKRRVEPASPSPLSIYSPSAVCLHNVLLFTLSATEHSSASQSKKSPQKMGPGENKMNMIELIIKIWGDLKDANNSLSRIFWQKKPGHLETGAAGRSKSESAHMLMRKMIIGNTGYGYLPPLSPFDLFYSAQVLK